MTFKIDPRELWWCNAHQRKATHFYVTTVTYSNGDEAYSFVRDRCDPKLAGILIPCYCVELTGLVEIEEI